MSKEDKGVADQQSSRPPRARLLNHGLWATQSTDYGLAPFIDSVVSVGYNDSIFADQSTMHCAYIPPITRAALEFQTYELL
jgi:hypothetical protein